MLHHLAAVGLAPVLLVQGVHVRRTVPRLPEPPGPRAGEAGAGPPLRLLVAGDSAAAGVGAASQSEALSGRVVEALAGDFRVRWRLVAATGATTRHALETLRRMPRQPFDVALTSLGVNDVVAGSTVRAWLRRQAALVDLLRDAFGARQIVLSGLPPVHLFPALPQPLRWVLGSRSRRFDRALARWAAPRDGCEHLALDFALERTAMASDGFHPGPLVYARWGREVGERIRARWPASLPPA